jgi:polyphosphate glucokinase
VRTLSIDVGGSGIKALVLDDAGQPLTERARERTPRPATPDAVIAVMEALAGSQGPFDRVSVGFPGVVRAGTTWTAHNLDDAWIGWPLAERLAARLGRPVRALNDADMQGFAAIEGRGVELVLTLGTGFGSALFVDGRLVPNLELAHHPFRKGRTYEELLGDAARRSAGRARWSRQLARALAQLERLFSYDVVYLGGGNAPKAAVETGPRVRVVPNVAGLLGGIACWRD